MKERFYRLCATLLIPLMITLNCPVAASAATSDTSADIKVKHKPVKTATAGQRVTIDARIVDASGVSVGRIYFRATNAGEYCFVPLESTGGDNYRAVLPAPANGAKSFDYLILVKNGDNQVVKTQTFTVAVEDDEDAGAAVAKNDQIQVYTELEQAPSEIAGFSDNVSIDVVASAGRLGVVAGLYALATTGESTSGAVAGGTVIATSGASTAMVVTGVVLAAAAVGGGVAGAMALSEEDDEEGGSAEELTSSTILGSWNLSGSNGTCTTSGTKTYLSGGRFTASVTTVCPSSTFPESGNGDWSLQGSTLSERFDTGVTSTASVSGDSNSFTATQSNGWTTTYTR